MWEPRWKWRPVPLPAGVSVICHCLTFHSGDPGNVQGGCGDQLLKGVIEGILVGGPAGPEAGVQGVGPEVPRQDQEAVLFHELTGHSALLPDCGQAFGRDVDGRGAGAVQEDTVGVNTEDGVGPDAEAVDRDPVKPVTGGGGGNVLAVGSAVGAPGSAGTAGKGSTSACRLRRFRQPNPIMTSTTAMIATVLTSVSIWVSIRRRLPQPPPIPGTGC